MAKAQAKKSETKKEELKVSPEVQIDFEQADYSEVKNKALPVATQEGLDLELETPDDPKELSWYERLLVEKEDLEGKITGIQNFIDKDPKYKDLDQVSRTLTLNQYKAMKEYFLYLERRIDMLSHRKEE